MSISRISLCVRTWGSPSTNWPQIFQGLESTSLLMGSPYLYTLHTVLRNGEWIFWSVISMLGKLWVPKITLRTIYKFNYCHKTRKTKCTNWKSIIRMTLSQRNDFLKCRVNILNHFFCVNSLALRHCTELCFLPFNNRTIPHLKNKENRKSLLLFFVKKKEEKNVNGKSSFCIRLWQLFKHY